MAPLRTFIKTVHRPVDILRRVIECFGIPEYMEQEARCLPTPWCEKSLSEAERLRNLGNLSYRSKNYDDALMYYSQSIAHAPNDSEALAFAYGNRSAIHLFQKNYELCLLDSNRALDGSLSPGSRQTLLKRKAKCWDELQDQNARRMKIRAGILRIKCSPQERTNIKACENKLFYVSKVDIDDNDLVIDRSLIDDPIWTTKFDNAQLENVSSKVRLRGGGLQGRHLVAASNIAPGEVLALDEIYSLNTNASERHRYCSYCHFRCEALIPCLHCTQEMYCCFSCREKAFDSYHEIEHKILPLWGSLPASVAGRRLLVLRAFLKGTEQGRELTSLMDDPKVYKAMEGRLDCAGTHYSMQDYITLLGSPWKYHDDVLDIHNENAKSQALAIFAGLHHAQFFGNEEKQIPLSGHTLKDEELFSILLLIHHGLSVSYHAKETRAASLESLEAPLKYVVDELGVGWGTWENFMSHSCNPNTVQVINGRRILWCSNKTIKAGEQISTSYGDWSFYENDLDVRQEMLRIHYNLECYCIACVEGWPLWASLIHDSHMHHCMSRKMMKKVEQLQDQLLRKLYHSIGEDELKKAIEIYTTYQKHAKESSPILNICSQMIWHCMKAKGDLYFPQKSITYCQNAS